MHRRGIVPLPAVSEAIECCSTRELVECCCVVSPFVKSDMNKKRGTIWVVVRIRGACHESQRSHGVREKGLGGSRTGKLVDLRGHRDAEGALPRKLLSPSRRRRAVQHLREVFSVSERRACQVTGQHRTTHRRPSRVLAPEEALRKELRAISSRRPRFGYRRAWALLRQEGWVVNRKRVQRLWRDEGLRVPSRGMKRHRLGAGTVPAERLRAERPNQVWAMDFLFDATSDGRPLKFLAMCDEFTRENIGRKVGRSITADDDVAVLDAACRVRGAPACTRCDNGPEFIAAAIRDWRRHRIHRTGIAVAEPVR
jgi:putative transposase